jgi:tetratricopeptide (TPR) repeat protein
MAKRSQSQQPRRARNSAKVTGNAAPAQGHPPWFTREGCLGAFLILAVILAYQPVWYAGFIWDDDVYLTNNPCIVGPLGLKEIWTTAAADICPLVTTTFWVEHAFWGLAPLPYHLVNVLFHGACAIFFWRVLGSLRVPGAWLGAALWALHPVQVESAAWIHEMKNTESGLFFLLSVFFFLRCLKTSDPGRRTTGVWAYAWTLFFAALAMASKSSTVILPLVLCLCAWWVEGRWQWRNLLKVGPVFLLSLAASAVSMWTQGLQLAEAADPQGTRTWPERLLTAGDAVWFYLGKLLWPQPLITIYPRWQVHGDQPLAYLPLAAVILVWLLLWLKRASWSRPYLFSWTYFLLALLPVLGLANMIFDRYSFVADHFQYLASMGPLALAGAGLVRGANFAIPGRPGLRSILGAGLLLVLGLWSWRQAWVYESQETLWTHTLDSNPNSWLGHTNLGNALLRQGQVDQAMSHYQQALALNPDYIEARNNLGLVLLQKGRVDESIAQYRKALEIDPDFDLAHNNLGLALLRKGQVDQAIAQYRQALALDPYRPEIHNYLGLALAQKGQVDEAMAEFQQALKINPGFAEAHYNLGNACLKQGRMDEAMTQYQQALEINPDYPNARNNLGVVLFQEGRVAEAIVQFQEALRLNPNDPGVLDNLAKAQALSRPAPGPK